jgi:hypothetical protein
VNTPEISQDTKIKVPLFMVVGLTVFTFSLGGIANEVLNNVAERKQLEKNMEDKIEKLQSHLEGEVQGLRSDWERRNKDVEKRLDKLEK